MRHLGIALALAMWSAAGWAQQPAAKRPPANAPKADAGMVVTGDQEAPLVLTIVPWQEPKPLGGPPVVPILPALPTVLDFEGGLAEDPMSRPLPSK